MNETEFHQLVDSQLERIEAAIDEAARISTTKRQAM